MIKMATKLQWKWKGLVLASLISFSCDTEDIDPEPQGEVTLSSPTVEPDGSLSLNATAGFEAEITGLDGNPSLVYEWSLAAGKGTLILENQERGHQTQTSAPSVTVRGDDLGNESLRVKVLNEATARLLGEDLLSFQITEAVGCYSELTIFYRNNDWGNPAMAGIGMESGNVKTLQLSPDNWLMDISPNGQWFLRQDFSDRRNYTIWLEACDGSGSRFLAEGPQIEGPTFGPNGKYVYFSELISYPEQTQDPRAVELVRVDIETGEKVFISEFRVFSSEPRVSPNGNWIAFEHSESTFNPNGTYAGSITHLAVMPIEGGAPRFLVPIESNDLAGFDWSPDSEHLIFNWHKQSGSSDTHTNGIYRISRGGGAGPSLVFTEPEGNGRPIYYADGTRIAFHGHPAGESTQFGIWSIDANGGDLQRLSTNRYNGFLQFIWEP